MLDIIFRSILVEFIGASVKWLFYAVKNSIKGEKIVSFSEIWKGKKGSKDTTLFFHGLIKYCCGLYCNYYFNRPWFFNRCNMVLNPRGK